MKKGLCENGQNFIKGLAEEKDIGNWVLDGWIPQRKEWWSKNCRWNMNHSAQSE